MTNDLAPTLGRALSGTGRPTPPPHLIFTTLSPFYRGGKPASEMESHRPQATLQLRGIAEIWRQASLRSCCVSTLPNTRLLLR